MELPMLDTRKVLLDHLLAKVTPLCSTKLLAKEILLEIANNLQNKDILHLLQNEEALLETVSKSKACANEKEDLGENLFVKVSAIESDLCSKITGMLLELDTNTIKQLLSDEQLLVKAIEKAKREYIDYANQQQRKEVLGEALYYMVLEHHRPDIASHLTGMLLELEPDLIQRLLKNKTEFVAKLQGNRRLFCRTHFGWEVKMAKQQELSDFIKQVHINLRLKARKVGSQEAWKEHCEDEKLLQDYAEAMQVLAKKFWDKNHADDPAWNRIHWVVEKCKNYFLQNGRENAILKEYKLEKRFFGEKGEPFVPPFDKLEKIKLLDVGSCYNPFKKFVIFDVTAIDLSPACDSVLKCDFLSMHTDTLPGLIPHNFDVVVFSFLLEYLPDPSQRFTCCKKAYHLLKSGGILIILTPDSKHATANSQLMKNWRKALALIGFIRVVYEKLKHMHCMAFMKCFNPLVPQQWVSLQQGPKLLPESYLRIPQDDNNYEISYVLPNIERNEFDNKNVANAFAQLAGEELF